MFQSAWRARKASSRHDSHRLPHVPALFVHKGPAFHVLCASTDSLVGHGGQGHVRRGLLKEPTSRDHGPCLTILLALAPSVMFYTPTTRGQGELQIKHWESTRVHRSGGGLQLPYRGSALGGGCSGRYRDGFTEGWCMSLIWKGSHDRHVAGGQGNGRSDERDSTKHGGREDHEDIN